MIRIVNYIRFNKEKWLTIRVWLWTAAFRLIILLIPAKYMKKYYGVSGEESPKVESKDHYVKAR